MSRMEAASLNDFYVNHFKIYIWYIFTGPFVRPHPAVWRLVLGKLNPFSTRTKACFSQKLSPGFIIASKSRKSDYRMIWFSCFNVMGL